jgi:Xaa-Pro aminopeptidase
VPELPDKLAAVQAMLERRGLDALHVQRADNVAWLTGGARVYVDTSSERGVASLLVTPNGQYLVTNNIEAPRLASEEPMDGWTLVVDDWYDAPAAVADLTTGLTVATDYPTPGTVDVAAELVAMRAPLHPGEVEAYRALGADLGRAMGNVAHAVEPGMTEHAIAGVLAREVYAVGAVPIVALVATDERLEAHRHPLPTDRALRSTLMFVACARRQGLIANATRMVSFGRPTSELRRRVEAVATIEACAHAATRPGASARDVFAKISEHYRKLGFDEEWRRHHQGGACSYAARDWIATSRSPHRIHAPQAFAWNPSVPGAKSEDTILCTNAGVDVLTRTPGWPMLEVPVDGETVLGNDILER